MPSCSASSWIGVFLSLWLVRCAIDLRRQPHLRSSSISSIGAESTELHINSCRLLGATKLGFLAMRIRRRDSVSGCFVSVQGFNDNEDLPTVLERVRPAPGSGNNTAPAAHCSVDSGRSVIQWWPWCNFCYMWGALYFWWTVIFIRKNWSSLIKGHSFRKLKTIHRSLEISSSFSCSCRWRTVSKAQCRLPTNHHWS